MKQTWQGASRLSYRLFSTAVVSRVFSFTLHHLDRFAFRLTGGRFIPSALVTGLPEIMLTTTGAKSGEPRTVPLVAMRDGDKLVLIASNWGGLHHPAWYYNLCAHSEAHVTLNGQTRAYIAQQAYGAERERYYERAIRLYIGYAKYRERAQGREIPVMVLTPSGN